MVTLTLDSNVMIDLVRGRRPIVRERFGEAMIGSDQIVISLIVLHELLYGCERHPHPQHERGRVQAAVADVEIKDLDERDVTVAAKLRADLAGKGQPIGAFDLFIAGQALARDWTLVTANTREFSRIEGLKIIDWTAPQG